MVEESETIVVILQNDPVPDDVGAAADTVCECAFDDPVFAGQRSSEFITGGRCVDVESVIRF